MTTPVHFEPPDVETPDVDPVPVADPLDPGGLPAKLTIPHPRPFTAALQVSTTGLSRAVDHVSNVEYLRWIDRVAELHSDRVGYTRKRLLDDGVMWFVARHEIDYVAEAHGGDELRLITWVRDVQRVKSWRETLIVRPADRKLICRTASLWVLVNLERRRPVRVPAEMAAALDPLTTPSRRPATKP